MSARLLVLVVAALAAVGAIASPASASLGGEVAAGQQVAAQLQSGQAICRGSSTGQFEQLGEYVMDRMVRSRAAHAAMNERMSRAIGVENTDRMHELMGRSFAGCTAGASGVLMGPGMMGGGYGGDWGGMMGSSTWGWMHSGAWRQMSQADWRKLAGTMMGARYTTAGDHGWSAAAVIAVVLGAILVGGLLGLLLVRRPWQRRRPGAPSAA